MLSSQTSYHVDCDCCCRTRSPDSAGPDKAHLEALRAGWEYRDSPLGGPRIYRCSKCVTNGLYPDGWLGGRQ